MKTYKQKFGARKAFKYRKHASDLRDDIARLGSDPDNQRLIGLLRGAAEALERAATVCDPFDGL